MFAVIAFLGIILVIPFHKKKETQVVINSSSIRNSIETSEQQSYLLLNNSSRDTSIKTIDHIFDLSSKNETFEKALCSKKFFACFLMALCSSCNINT